MPDDLRVPHEILRDIYVPSKEYPGSWVCRECGFWLGNAHEETCRLGWLQWADRMLAEETKSSTIMLAAIVRALGGSVQVLNADLVSIKPDDALIRRNEADRIVLEFRPNIR